MHGLISDRPLMISSLLEHAARYHGKTEINSADSKDKITTSTVVSLLFSERVYIVWQNMHVHIVNLNLRIKRCCPVTLTKSTSVQDY